jgi:protein ImuA
MPRDVPEPARAAPEPRLRALRDRIAAIESAGRAGCGRQALDGGGPLDAALGGGLPRGGVHEIVAGDYGPALGFAAALTARLAGTRGHVVWLARSGELHPPGLARFGPDFRRLLLVRATDDADALWAAEEALRSPGVAALVAGIRDLDLTACRRLQLAAETHGATALLLRPPRTRGIGAALSRWRIEAAPSRRAPAFRAALRDPGEERWAVDLLRARGRPPARWTLEWQHATHRFAVAAAAGDRPAAAHAAG